MLNTFTHLTGATVTATNGSIGHIRAAFFDDQHWTIRYVVVGCGSWLAERDVLISPYAIQQPVGSDNNINVSLTQEQVKGSPDVDTQQPVSRQQEIENLRYYGYPDYWEGGTMWGLGAYPMLPPVLSPTEAAAAEAAHAQDVKAADIHLRSSAKVIGYDIQGIDESIGHVQDFVFDDESWAIRYLVVDTRNWWPGGKKVLIAIHWIDQIDWATSSVKIALTREQIKASPPYDDKVPLARVYEQSLHDTYNWRGYWD
jgi:hypothetical protein